MTHSARIIRQVEVAAGCLLGAGGSMVCFMFHYCMCGHLAHGGYREVMPWIVDGVAILGFLVAGVVGLRGGFLLARTTAVLALMVVVVSGLARGAGALGPVVAVPFLLLGLFHVFGVGHYRRQASLRSKQLRAAAESVTMETSEPL